ncbi:uncharacterized protein PAC_18159 [Phialocephala subalpina]|uniref:Gfd2/YDR514C-like C-terminal domain-containing protein n=1 Tax=Phialocephala subalpina TaxID=576137 RepID=A0A1L7XT88_9HELO|nr:uncharacterized protein PAC_18159 [Phialocephala subalpina]
MGITAEAALKSDQRLHRIREDKRHFDLSVLRCWLGLSTAADACFSSSGLSCESARFQDPVLVSLDTEGQLITEFGLSILDTRDLQNLAATDDLAAAISNHNFILRKRWGRDDKHFKFGTSKSLEPRWTRWVLEKVLRTGSLDPDCVEPRNVILVGHALAGDLQLLTRQPKGKFDILDFPDIPIIDTSHFGRTFFDLRSDPSLVVLANRLGIKKSSRGFYNHNAGNDANMTLKVLIMFAVKSCGEEVTDTQRERMELLTKVIETSKPGRWVEVCSEDRDRLNEEHKRTRAEDWTANFEDSFGFSNMVYEGVI